MRNTLLIVGLLVCSCFSATRAAAELPPGDPAPVFTAKPHDGGEFTLESRRGT